jgi:acetyltransferase-like isoleucine patch superfamily enzyme
MRIINDLNGYFWNFVQNKKFLVLRTLTNILAHIILKSKGVSISKNVSFRGIPYVRRYPESKIYFGENSRFNSLKKSVELYIASPCTFITCGHGAKIIIGKNVGGTSISLLAKNSITIGNNVLMGHGTTIMDSDFHHPDPNLRNSKNKPNRPIVIEDNVFLGKSCTVLKGVTIGENSVIGSDSLVITNIPPNSIAIGNPCKVIIRKKWPDQK